MDYQNFNKKIIKSANFLFVFVLQFLQRKMFTIKIENGRKTP